MLASPQLMRLDDGLDLLGGDFQRQPGDLESGGGGDDERWAGSTDHVVEKIDGGVEFVVGDMDSSGGGDDGR